MIQLRKIGKVINFDGKKVYIITKNKDFVELHRNERTPIKGELYAGEVYKKKNYTGKVAFTIIFFVLIFSVFQYINYYRTTLTLIIKMDASIHLKVNKYNRIIGSKGINSKGKNVIENVTINNNHLNDALNTLVDQCISQKIIDQAFIKSNKRIILYITDRYSDLDIDVSEFKNHIKKYKLKAIINNNGNGVIE